MEFDNYGAVNLSAIPMVMRPVCKLSGAEAKLRRKELLSLRDCEQMLEHSIRDLRSAETTYNWARGAELAARVVVIACDITIMTLEEKTGPAGMLVGKTYGGAKLLVKALTDGAGEKDAWVLLAEGKATIIEKSIEMAGKKNAAKVFGRLKNLFVTAESLWSHVSEQGGGAGFAGSINARVRDLGNLRAQIRDIEQELVHC